MRESRPTSSFSGASLRRNRVPQSGHSTMFGSGRSRTALVARITHLLALHHEHAPPRAGLRRVFRRRRATDGPIIRRVVRMTDPRHICCRRSAFAETLLAVERAPVLWSGDVDRGDHRDPHRADRRCRCCARARKGARTHAAYPESLTGSRRRVPFASNATVPVRT